jgi:hypothetical protein
MAARPIASLTHNKDGIEGYPHREHRSKRGRAKDAAFKRGRRAMKRQMEVKRERQLLKKLRTTI